MYKLSCFMFLLILFLISGCNDSVDKNELKIIDNVQLGTDVNEYLNSLSNLNVEKQYFLSEVFFSDYNLNQNIIPFPYTKQLDLGHFKSSQNSHLGLFYPQYLEGTDNIIAFSVILVHTEKPLFFLSKGIEPRRVSDKYISISQHVSSDFIDAVENMYISKYGKARDTTTEPMSMISYKIQGQEIKAYSIPEIKDSLQEIIWETKYLTVRLFKGISSSEEKFDKKDHRYYYRIGTNAKGLAEVKDIKVDYSNGETMCRTYSFIHYRLKQEVISKLKLDKKKI